VTLKPPQGDKAKNAFRENKYANDEIKQKVRLEPTRQPLWDVEPRLSSHLCISSAA
jgi:hypothetical protein